MTKKIDIFIYVILIAIVGVLALTFFPNNKESEPIEETDTKITGINIDKNNITMYIGDSSVINATIVPSEAKNKGFIWNSSNTSVATVNNGIINAINIGEADITVGVVGSNIKEICHVKVIERDIEKLVIEKDELSLKVGDKKTINVTIEPNIATNKKLIFRSTDESIASVDENGVVIAKRSGSVDIIITDSKGKNEVRCRITVSEPLEKIEIDKSIELKVGESKILKAVLIPSTTTDTIITWKSSNESIASVTSTGEVRAKKSGTATITVTGANNISSSCKVTVKEIAKTKYTVTYYDINKSITREEGAKLGTMPSPTKKNNVFIGWYTKSSGGNKVDENTIVRSNMTLYAHWQQTIKDNLEMHFINGGGYYDDAILIRSNNATIFIDGGRGEAAVVQYLKESGVKTIDLVIGSHTEYDHIYAQGGVIRTFNVKNVIYPNSIYNCGCSCDSKDVSNVLEGLSAKGITAKVQQAPSVLTVGDMKLYFIGPWEIGCNKNDNSFIFVLKFKNNTFLFTGDSDGPLNKTQILSANMQKLGLPTSKVDMFKYPHHGNKYLLNETLDLFRPSFVVVPNMNAPSYPSQQMRALISRYGSLYRLSDSKTGNILVKSDGSRINVIMDVLARNYAR